MAKQLTSDELLRLNQLLQETLQQAGHEQLCRCVRILATMVASLKVKYQADDEAMPNTVKELVSALEQNRLSDDCNEILSRSIVECATALAVSKQAQAEEPPADANPA